MRTGTTVFAQVLFQLFCAHPQNMYGTIDHEASLLSFTFSNGMNQIAVTARTISCVMMVQKVMNSLVPSKPLLGHRGINILM